MATRSSRYLQMAAYVLLACIFVFVIGITRNCSHLNQESVEGYSQGDTLDIAVIYGPGSYYVYGDSLNGINLALAHIFEKETLSPVKIWPVNEPAYAMDKLEAGAFDILASLPLDNYIKNRFPVSESIFLDRLVLIQLADSASGKTHINSSLELDGKEIYVSPGSSAIQRLQNLANEIGGQIEIIQMPELSDDLLCLQVATGQIPLAVVNERVAKSLAKQYPLLKYDSSVSFTQFQVWVFNPADTLAAKKFNGWFETFRQTPQYRNLITSF